MKARGEKRLANIINDATENEISSPVAVTKEPRVILNAKQPRGGTIRSLAQRRANVHNYREIYAN